MTHRVPVLPVDELLLEPWSTADAPAVLALADDDECRRWSSSLRPVRTTADALAWIERRLGPDRADWVVRDAGTGAVVGRVGLHVVDAGDRTAEIGYGVLAGHRRRGVARRVVAAALGHGFGELGLCRVSLIHAVGNPASCGVATACGFTYEGVERAAIDHGDGIRHDVHRHARLATDPPGPAAPPPSPIEPVEISAGSVQLRPWEACDAADVLAAFREPHIVRWNPRLPLCDDSAALAWVRGRLRGWTQGEMAAWSVRDATTGELLGSATLRGLARQNGWGVASYWVRAGHRGRGVAPQALAAATRFGFAALGLHRVALYHAVANAASCRVAAKAGFPLEGTLRGSDRLAEGWVDEHLHARLAGDP